MVLVVAAAVVLVVAAAVVLVVAAVVVIAVAAVVSWRLPCDGQCGWHPRTATFFRCFLPIVFLFLQIVFFYFLLAEELCI